jgi:hypothetical protein
MKARMAELEKEKAAREERLAAVPEAPLVRLHPNLAKFTARGHRARRLGD